MTSKHPTLGKKTLAMMYFLRKSQKVELNMLGQWDQNSPAPETNDISYLKKKCNFFFHPEPLP